MVVVPLSHTEIIFLVVRASWLLKRSTFLPLKCLQAVFRCLEPSLSKSCDGSVHLGVYAAIFRCLDFTCRKHSSRLVRSNAKRACARCHSCWSNRRAISISRGAIQNAIFCTWQADYIFNSQMLLIQILVLIVSYWGSDFYCNWWGKNPRGPSSLTLFKMVDHISSIALSQTTHIAHHLWLFYISPYYYHVT